jgi:hypothetical protein
MPAKNPLVPQKNGPGTISMSAPKMDLPGVFGVKPNSGGTQDAVSGNSGSSGGGVRVLPKIPALPPLAGKMPAPPSESEMTRMRAPEIKVSPTPFADAPVRPIPEYAKKREASPKTYRTERPQEKESGFSAFSLVIFVGLFVGILLMGRKRK